MFNVQTIKHAVLWTGCNSNSVAITQWNKYTHGTLSSKNTTICFNWKEAIWSLTKKKKQGDKKEKLTESLHLTVKIARRSNYNIDLRKLRVNKITGRRNHKAALNEKPTDSPQWFFIRSSIKQFSFEDKGNFTVYDKDYRNVWTSRKHATDAIRWIQATIPLKFLIIIHNYANV